MSSLPSDPTTAAAFARFADELRAIRSSLEALTTENHALRSRLEHSERARDDLFAQTERILELLADARREVRHLRGGGDA